ncbi:MAG: hypothetical protein MUC66_06715, partial [Methanolinea sp.]|nr:hypothetical protein [Methanolinea sp.]
PYVRDRDKPPFGSLSCLESVESESDRGVEARITKFTLFVTLKESFVPGGWTELMMSLADVYV